MPSTPTACRPARLQAATMSALSMESMEYAEHIILRVGVSPWIRER
jgi:hypothetical protein